MFLFGDTSAFYVIFICNEKLKTHIDNPIATNKRVILNYRSLITNKMEC